MHLAIRLDESPVILFDPLRSAVVRFCGDGVVGGPRRQFHLKEASAPSSSVGAVLRPGASLALLGVTADELAGQHTRLSELIGATAARCLVERLAASPSPGHRAALLESFLTERLLANRWRGPFIAGIDNWFDTPTDVGTAVAQSGISHRHFNQRFKRLAGLSPKVYQRVRRLQPALAQLHARPDVALVDLALASGFADQAHFQREFRSVFGLTPLTYRRRTPRESHHVACVEPALEVKNLQYDVGQWAAHCVLNATLAGA